MTYAGLTAQFFRLMYPTIYRGKKYVGEFVGRFIKIREGFFLSSKRARAGFNEFFSLSF